MTQHLQPSDSVQLEPRDTYLLQCLRVASRLIPLAELKAPELSAADWDFVLEALSWHRLLTFVYSGLPLEQFSERQRTYCNSVRRKCILRFLIKLDDFKEIKTVLENRHVPYAPIKGMFNSLTLYKADPFRIMGDIDVLVRSADLPRAYSALYDAGFRVKVDPSRLRGHESLIAESYQPPRVPEEPRGRMSLFRGSVEIDLHWSINYEVAGNFDFSPADFYWQGATVDHEMGDFGHRLSPDRHCLNQSIHAAVDEFRILMHAMDVIRLQNSYALNLDKIVSEPWLKHNRKDLDIFCGFIRTISSLQNDLSTLPLSDFLLFKNYSNSKIEQAAKVKPIEGIGAVSRHLGKLGRLTGIKRKMRYLLGFFLPELSFYSGKTKREIYRLHYGEHFSKVDAIASSLWGKTEKTS